MMDMTFFLLPMCTHVDLEEKGQKEPEKSGQENEEKKESKEPVDRADTGQKKVKTDRVEQEQVENKRPQEEQQPNQEEKDNNPGWYSGFLRPSLDKKLEKKVENRSLVPEKREKSRGQVLTALSPNSLGL